MALLKQRGRQTLVRDRTALCAPFDIRSLTPAPTIWRNLAQSRFVALFLPISTFTGTIDGAL